MGINLNYIESESGKVYYRISGAENSRTIIFVHGLAADSRFFHNQLKYFGNSFRVLAIDLPGHGRSRRTDELSAAVYSRSIEQVVKKECLESYILAGHSMGGAVCLEHYKNNHHKIQALILISTASKIPVTEEMVKRSIIDFRNFFDDMLSAIFFKKAGIFILAAKKSIDEEERAIITDDLKICMSIDHDDVLGKINIPVLLLANRYDSMISAELTANMRNTIPDSNGHIPFFEESELFNSTLEKFLTSIQ
jgi:pimeloyl-ACP methyl ester carboxylesterase